ncbi:hypothetical protein HYH03_002463 [Edaphochlamys debaryana]|uniref:PUA domain-containing protein n=1 Tax=Edaphochlamys debaryana TaxID=47281 RepID=A0A835YBD7_9CHLO|nr:hypothetical protein HYH03_002463 [Edaphochlamys debaryana]|eukprot:KAG2499516.1 hypothetical protein HYH03_002463 [Edaphochlamys debaryana]
MQSACLARSGAAVRSAGPATRAVPAPAPSPLADVLSHLTTPSRRIAAQSVRGRPPRRPRGDAPAADANGEAAAPPVRVKRAAGAKPTKPASKAADPAVQLPADDADVAEGVELLADAEVTNGVDGLDELLANPDAVQELRSALLSSLSRQHEAAMTEETGDGGSGSGTAAAEAAADPAAAAAVKEPKKAKGDGASAAGADAAGADGPTAVLKKDKARLFLYGNPMVYGGAVDCVIGRPPPQAGDPVWVTDHSRRRLGWGVFNPHSMFRVRLLQQQSEVDADPSLALDLPRLLTLRVRQAAELRRALGLGPASAPTTVYRLINSEGDRLSGLTADVLGEAVVVQATAAWVQKHRPEVEAAITAATGLSRIVWRPQWRILAEEGLTPPEGAGQGQAQGGEEGEGEGGGESERVEVCEGGLRLLACPTGQKTGFYADQRDSRAFLGALVRQQSEAAAVAGQQGPAVLDLCCYSGGFALAAAAAGAGSVTGVDSSEAAVSLAAANADLNGLGERASFVRADVADYMREALEQGRQYDIVILDPPKLAPNAASLDRARVKYLKLNKQALALVRPGGLLMTCSCSGAMTQAGGLPGVVSDAARQTGRQVTLLREAGAAPCHPLQPAYPEGRYLTNLTFRVL